MLAGILPDVMILQHPNAGDTITVHAEPGRVFSITCLSSVRVVMWTRPGIYYALYIRNKQIEVCCKL